jgi:hypothetical protein
MKTQILYPFAHVMGIFFPVGDLKDGGTCEFSTDVCKEKCCAISHKKIGANKKFKEGSLKYFKDNDADTIASQIHKELNESSSVILKPKFLVSWFASGDCPSYLIDKIHQIILNIRNRGIIQNGMTRNKDLWNKIKDFEDGRFLLTKEKTSSNLTVEDFKDDEEGLYSIPNYDSGTIDIVKYVNHTIRISRGCGGGYYTDHIIKNQYIKSKEKYLDLNCRKCFEKRIGCFTN